MSYYGFKPYVPVAARRAKAAKEMAKLAKKGRVISPVAIPGKKIAETFWGKAWCDNLESYSDYESRLPRGRTYVRNGSVVDLQVERGRVRATVSGSELYTVSIDIGTLPKPRWEAICRDCAGSVGSLVELLQGKLSKNVMERVCRQGDGLFPSPGEIELKCSCPDWSVMCKHVAATLYGVGARLDAKPDLLFELRGVDRAQLIAKAGKDLPLTQRPVADDRVLAEDDVAALFGIEMDAALPPAEAEPPKPAEPSRKPAAAIRAAPPKSPRPASAAKPAAARPPETKAAIRVVVPAAAAKVAAVAKPAPATKKPPNIAAAVPAAKSARRVPILTPRWPKAKKPRARPSADPG